MSSSAASFTALPAIPAAHATFTARYAGCWMGDVKAVSASSVDSVAPQSSNVQSASGEPLQSPGQNRPDGGGIIGPGAGGGGGRVIDPGAIWLGSPSDINASRRD